MPSSGNVEGFANFGPDVKGESQDDRHLDWVEFVSLRTGVTHAGANLCGASGATVFDQVVLRKLMDAATVPLTEHAAADLVIGEVTIELVRSGADRFKFYEMRLTDVVVDRIRTAWGQGVPFEEVVLSFGTVEISYTTQDPTGGIGGTISFCWDVQAQAIC